MRSLVIVSVVLGAALAQVLPRDTPEVEAARNAFIAEYNRLARIAALAPDIHIYHRDPQLDPVTNQVQPLNPPAFNAFSFSANLGSNQQFVPGPATFPGASHMPGHLAGHNAGHQFKSASAAPKRVQIPAAPTHVPVLTPAPLFKIPDFSSDPIMRWRGPFADEVPAGLGGHVVETPSVAAAKAAHFQAHAEFRNKAFRSRAL